MMLMEVDTVASGHRAWLISRIIEARQHLDATTVSGTLVALMLVWMLAEGGALVDEIVRQEAGARIAMATAGVVMVAALVSGVAGFAFSALAGGALAYLEIAPAQAVQTLVVCSIATQFYATWKIRASIDWTSVWPMLAAGVVTVPLGVWLLVHADGPYYAAGLGAFLVVYGGYVATRREGRAIAGGGWRDATAGALGGLSGGFAGLPGPFVTIWCALRGWDTVRQRAVYQPYILAMQVMTFACLRGLSPTRIDVVHNMRFVPFALLGAMGGFALFQRLTSRQFRVALAMLLVASGLGLLARGV